MNHSLPVAQLNIQDVKLVVVFLDRPASASDYAVLENAAAQAGLDGELVAVWPDEFGRTRFFARAERHPFFRAVGYEQLRAQINATLRR